MTYLTFGKRNHDLETTIDNLYFQGEFGDLLYVERKISSLSLLFKRREEEYIVSSMQMVYRVDGETSLTTEEFTGFTHLDFELINEEWRVYYFYSQDEVSVFQLSHQNSVRMFPDTMCLTLNNTTSHFLVALEFR